MNAVKKSSSFTPAGSPVEGEPAFLVIGKIRRPHGVRGDVLMEVISDFPERIQPGVTVYVGEDAQPQQITSRRTHKDGLILHFAAYSTAEAVGVLRNAYVFVRADDRPALETGEFYHHQLLGLAVYTDQGEELGRIVEILETGANDVFGVQNEEGKKVYIPYIDEFVTAIDLEQGKITVHLIPGLI
jgi:16S rRNA processing protein RimM